MKFINRNRTTTEHTKNMFEQQDGGGNKTPE